MKNAISWRKMISLVLALILCVSLPITIWAETTTTQETITNGDGTTTVITTQTSTETDTNGNTVVTVTIQKDTTGTLADGTIVKNSETRTDTTTTDPDGNLIGSSWEEDGSEKKTNITEDDGNEPGQPPVDVSLIPGKSTEGTSEPNVTVNPDGSTTTEIDRTVTATTTETEVKVEESEDLLPDAETVLSGPAPVYDENDNAVLRDDGKLHDGYGKDGMFDRNFLSETAKYTNTDNWVMPEGAEFRLVGTGEHCVYYNARVTVVYDKNEDGSVRLDEEGNPIIKAITKSDGTPITIDGVNATELPDEITLEPIYDNYNGGRPKTFKLMDKNGNRVYAYCCDMETDAKEGSWYTVSNLEDSEYYATEESEEHIRSIVMNGYWGTSDVQKEDGSYELGSLEGIKSKLRDAINGGIMENEVIQIPVLNEDGTPAVDESGNPVVQSKTMLELIDELTEGEALLATQSAIWSFSNGNIGVQNGKDGVIVVDPDGYVWNHDPNNGSKIWTDGNGTKWDLGTLDDFGSARVDFLYKWLIALDTEEESTVVINENNFVKDLTLTVLDKVAEEAVNQDDNDDNDIYNTNLNFKLAFIPSSQDSLLVQINYIDLDGNPVSMVRRLAGENAEGESFIDIKPDENGNYVIENIKLSENQDFAFDLKLEGTQYLEHGVYVYSPVGGRKVSQSFVGIAEGNRNVDVSIGVSIKFNVDEDNKTVYERVWHDGDDPQNTPPETPENPPETPNNPPVTPNDPPETPEEPPIRRETPPTINEEPPVEEEFIPEEDVPLDEEPVGGPDDEIEILDEEVPLAEVPETGDASTIFMMLAIFSTIGLIAVNFPRKKVFHF